ncbi:hypothetical protein ACWEQC_24080 [Streptomyces shenzhenensis]
MDRDRLRPSGDLGPPFVQQRCGHRGGRPLRLGTGGPGHPVAGAAKLADLTPNSTLRTARTPGDLRAWGDLAAAFVNE